MPRSLWKTTQRPRFRLFRTAKSWELSIRRFPAPQPTSGTVQVVAGVSLSMQGDVDGNWDLVCSVPAKQVANNITVKNNVPWGGSCPISVNPPHFPRAGWANCMGYPASRLEVDFPPLKRGRRLERCLAPIHTGDLGRSLPAPEPSPSLHETVMSAGRSPSDDRDATALRRSPPSCAPRFRATAVDQTTSPCSAEMVRLISNHEGWAEHRPHCQPFCTPRC